MIREWSYGRNWTEFSTILSRSWWLHQLLQPYDLMNNIFCNSSKKIGLKEQFSRIISLNLYQIIGFAVGAIPWLKSLFIGASAPLRVVQGSIKLLGWLLFCCIRYCSNTNPLYEQKLLIRWSDCCSDGTVPCITLILGGNLTQGKVLLSFCGVCILIT